MATIGWYGVDPLMTPADRLGLRQRDAPTRAAPLIPAGVRPLGVRLARRPIIPGPEAPQCGEHSKTYTVERRKENTKVIIDGTEENHVDEKEVERETD